MNVMVLPLIPVPFELEPVFMVADSEVVPPYVPLAAAVVRLVPTMGGVPQGVLVPATSVGAKVKFPPLPEGCTSVL
jgi:hypothetical protein